MRKKIWKWVVDLWIGTFITKVLIFILSFIDNVVLQDALIHFNYILDTLFVACFFIMFIIIVSVIDDYIEKE